MLVDLHVHTAVSSPCSQIDPTLLIEVASDMGLDAVCVTEHEEMEGAEMTRRLGAEAGFPVFRGVEVYTELGDMLVFGLYRASFPLRTPFAELLSEVRGAGGAIIPCHPCRGSLGFHHTLGEEQADFLLASVDAIETRNGGSSPESNSAAESYAEKYGLPGVGGSDAHFLMQVGRCLTVFERDIEGEAQLVDEIKAGRCRAAYASEVASLRMPELWR
ncbi:MAG: PHP domain-containing protein [Actinobacteria bacterium]|jgi:predicted metal-dependent phosphoesterase TrpH|nr:MAG: PHP domain-containing protein [Actinomycetota bacterium]